MPREESGLELWGRPLRRRSAAALALGNTVMKARRTRLPRRRSGQTLLELVAATTVIAMALVPSLRIMRDTIRIGRETEMANLLATLSASKMEEHLVRTAVNWSTATVEDDFGNEGYPQSCTRTQPQMADFQTA